MEPEKYLALRDNRVTKANALIQKSRLSLSLQQQKIMLYLISQISPSDDDFKLYEFSIPEFCRVCGIDDKSGNNYSDLKSALKVLRDNSIWVAISDDTEATVSWIGKAKIEKKRGTVLIRLDEDMKPYLLHLKNNFTSYELVYTLHFKSKYTIRLFHEMETYTKKYDVEELRVRIGAETYPQYRDFKRRALDNSVQEINEYSDKDLTYIEIKRGRKVLAIEFTIKTKAVQKRLEVRNKIDQDMGFLSGQTSLWGGEES